MEYENLMIKQEKKNEILHGICETLFDEVPQSALKEKLNKEYLEINAEYFTGLLILRKNVSTHNQMVKEAQFKILQEVCFKFTSKYEYIINTLINNI
jgi:hypothetical protein